MREVGELTRDESVRLCNKRGQSTEDAAAIYDLVGGHANLLRAVTDGLSVGLGFSGIFFTWYLKWSQVIIY